MPPTSVGRNRRPMSARKRRLLIAPEARADLNGIRLYTQQQWGVDQRRRYGDRLRQAMRSLVDHPELGTPRDDLYPGCRGLVVGRHVIFYRIAETEIVVGRVLHQNQEPTGKVRP
jgi:toxin ParE1/3/4